MAGWDESMVMFLIFCPLGHASSGDIPGVGCAIDFRIGLFVFPSRGEGLSAVGKESRIEFWLFLSGPGTLLIKLV